MKTKPYALLYIRPGVSKSSTINSILNNNFSKSLEYYKKQHFKKRQSIAAGNRMKPDIQFSTELTHNVVSGFSIGTF